MVPDQRFRRPVIRVGVGVVGATGGSRPGRPGDEGRDAVTVLGVGDGTRPEPGPAARPVEELLLVALPKFPEGPGLPAGPLQRVGLLVVAVGLQLATDLFLSIRTVAVKLPQELGLTVQVIGGEVWS